MLAKLAAIAWKDVYVAYRDRNAMLMMFAMPLAISLIIGLAFGSGGDISIAAVPVGVVNQDAGVSIPGGAVRFGQTFEQAFVESGDADAGADYVAIHALTDGYAYTDEQAARNEVERGELAAVLTIGETFSADALGGQQPGTLRLYYDSGRSIGPSVVQSIVSAISSGMNSVILAQRVGPAFLTELGGELGADETAITRAVQRASREAMSIGQQQSIRLEQLDLQGETREFDALQYFAPSMAILFMTFAMATGATSILIESQHWTLQRIITTPTPRWVFMGGKLAGMFVTGVGQMAVLIATTSLIALLTGREEPVWGTNIAGIVLLVLAVVLAATALGLLIAALSRTAAQASSYSTVAMFVLGMLGGSFIPIEGLPDALSWLPKLTLNYWGIDGFFDLAYEKTTLADIGTNVLALVAMGGVLFVIGLWRFNRRVDLGR